MVFVIFGIMCDCIMRGSQLVSIKIYLSPLMKSAQLFSDPNNMLTSRLMSQMLMKESSLPLSGIT